MFNNGYYGYNPQSYNQNYGYMPQQTQQFQSNAFSKVIYGTLDEAKAYILTPNESIMIINKELGEFYVKTADVMGKSVLEGFKYSKIDNNSSQPVSAEIDTKEFVKTSDLDKFATKQELENIYQQLASIQEQVKGDK